MLTEPQRPVELGFKSQQRKRGLGLLGERGKAEENGRGRRVSRSSVLQTEARALGSARRQVLLFPILQRQTSLQIEIHSVNTNFLSGKKSLRPVFTALPACDGSPGPSAPNNPHTKETRF